MVETTLTGRLIVAAPPLVDPNFRRCVVLLLHHGADGALGVILNRPSEVAVAVTLQDWDRFAAQPSVVFVGGPVEPNAVIGLGCRRGSMDVEGWQQVIGELGMLDLSRSPDEIGLDEVRLFAGHAGWAAGQLEAEVAAGSWFVVEAEPGDAFSSEPEGLWQHVLRRQGGVYRTFPHDPSLN
ncbi:MAG: YqgE/AlgH family protein [Nitriliruptorales bacterium]